MSLYPLVGSGSSCVAALRSGRNYIGYDLSQKNRNIAKSRLAKEYLSQTFK